MTNAIIAGVSGVLAAAIPPLIAEGLKRIRKSGGSVPQAFQPWRWLTIVSFAAGLAALVITLWPREPSPETKLDGMSSFSKGIILPWYTRQGPVPTGWAICDGTQGTPDLRNRFLMGGGSFGDVGIRGGLNSVPDRWTGEHVLTIHELPPHSHVENLSGGAGGEKGYIHTQSQAWGFKDNVAGVERTQNEGEGKGHSHPIPGYDNRPAFETVVFIMKL